MIDGSMTTPSIWQGRLVRLRAVEPGDWQHFSEWGTDTEFARYDYNIWFPWSREHSHKWTAELATSGPKSHEYRWVIETLEGEFAGTLNSHTCDPRAGTFRYGVAIRREHWRKGYAAEAIRLVLAFFFRELRYQKVNVEIY
jgi:RimJ/RimL family protein N-acetyltransferase